MPFDARFFRSTFQMLVTRKKLTFLDSVAVSSNATHRSSVSNVPLHSPTRSMVVIGLVTIGLSEILHVFQQDTGEPK